MSAAIIYLADLEDVRTGERSTTTPAASEDEALRNAEDVIRQKPNLRLLRIHQQASAVIAGEVKVTVNAEIVGQRQYDADFLLWTEQQTELLRRRAVGELPNDEGLDWLNLAEEIESVGVSQKREVRSRLMRICQHLLKWCYQPLRRTPSWRSTLYVQRRELLDLFEDSPSLRPFAERVLRSAYVNGRQAAEQETGPLGLRDDVCPWSLDQVVSIDFLPD